MLHIENIDLYSVRFGNGYGGGYASRTLPKNLEARTDVGNPDNDSRIWIWHKENNECVVNNAEVENIFLDGTTYASAELFAAAFNALMQDGTEYVITTTTTTA